MTPTLSQRHSPRHVPPPMLQADTWSYTSLLHAVNTHAVTQAAIMPDATVKAVDKTGILHVTQLVPAQVTALADRFASEGVDLTFQAPSGASILLRQVLDLFPYAIFFFIFLSALRREGSGLPLMGNSNPTANGIQLVKEVETTFEDVAGVFAAKEELREVVQFLKDPDRFREVGAKVPKGVLMEGPPGTGKTLLAKAVAGESGTAFLSVSASSFVEMYVGLGAARVRALFEEAKKQAPCIVWIDEIDAVGRKRGGSGVGAGNEERETTLNELLACMDGFDASSGVVVLAATNRADVLDEALIRSGRFDRRVPVTLPTRQERRQILDVHARGKTLDCEDDLDAIAARTPGFSGADLSNLMNEAAIRAARRNSTTVSGGDLENAVDRVTMGLPRGDDDSISDAIRERVAIHEAGHAVVAVVLGYDTISRVSIVPRSSGAGGFTAFVPDEDRSVGGLYTLEYLKTQLAVLLGGRAAEEVVLGRNTITTGASSDLNRVHTNARRMVSEWGFGSTLTAHGSSNVFGSDTSNAIDRDIDELVGEAYGTALSCINGNLLSLGDVSQLLLKERTIDGERVEHIVRDRLTKKIDAL